MHRWRRIGTAALSLLGLALVVLYVAAEPDVLGDSHTYWFATQQPDASVYARPWALVPDAFVYSPAYLQAIRPLGNLDWPTFHAFWTVLLVGALAVAVGPRWAIVFLTFAIPLRAWPVFEAVLWGNIELLFVLAIAIGFRYPAAWALIVLTKVTPGVGVIWFAARREWRSMWMALGATGLIAGASLLFAPGLWADWVGVLTGSTYQQPFATPLWIRVALAAALVYCGARLNQRWTVPIAVVVAHPGIWFNSLAIPLILVPMLLIWDRSKHIPAGDMTPNGAAALPLGPRPLEPVPVQMAHQALGQVDRVVLPPVVGVDLEHAGHP